MSFMKIKRIKKQKSFAVDTGSCEGPVWVKLIVSNKTYMGNHAGFKIDMYINDIKTTFHSNSLTVGEAMEKGMEKVEKEIIKMKGRK